MSSRAERLAARQVHEPLVSRESGPFGQARERPGLVRSLRPVAGGTIWTAKLRPGVRFGDGEPLDADAVIANAERWMQVGPGPGLVPDLLAVDSPRPGQVRFLLGRSEPRFPQALANPALGIVAPAAITNAAGGSVRVDYDGSGTGPFELRERESGRTLLARNASWWGTRLGLGPGVDQIELLDVPAAGARARQLLSGSVVVADDLDQRAARRVDDDPLLTTVAGDGSIVGLDRSVRGIEPGEDDLALADVWLTDLR